MPVEMPRSKKGANRHTDRIPPGQHHSPKRREEKSLRIKIREMQREAQETNKIE
jgi:hypothetical protein